MNFKTLSYIFFPLLFQLGCNPNVKINVIAGRPVITSLSPASGFIAGGNQLNISGSGFLAGASVTVGGNSCDSVNVISESSLSCVLPPQITAGAVDVVVTNTNQYSAKLTSGYNYKTNMFHLAETVFGNVTGPGTKVGNGLDARFFNPTDLVKDGNYLYISDTSNHAIRRYNISTSEVTEFAGTLGSAGYLDGVGTSAQFKNPRGLVITGNNLYVADNDNCRIRKIDLSTQVVTTVAGKGCLSDSTDDPVGLNAALYYPEALATDGSFIYFAEECGIRKMDLSGTNAVSLVMGNQTGQTTCYGMTNGPLGVAQFYGNFDIKLVGSIMYIADGLQVTSASCKIRKMDLSDSPITVSDVAGSTCSHTDGTGATVKFSAISNLASDGTNIYMTSRIAHTIRKYNITSTTASTIAGSSLVGNVDGVGTSAVLSYPSAMLVDGNILYFLTRGGANLRKMDLTTGEITSLAGGGQ